MMRSLGEMGITLVAMLLGFLGMRGYLTDTLPTAHPGWIEIGAYVGSVLYGLLLYDWLGSVIGRGSND